MLYGHVELDSLSAKAISPRGYRLVPDPVNALGGYSAENFDK